MLIKTRMSLAIALLSLGFIFFAASVFWAHWKEVQGANSLLSASQYLERATAVAHELQKERGFSVGLMSGAEKFKPLLHTQRQDTQTQLEALTAFVASKEGAELPVDLQQLHQRFLNGLQNRQSWQERVDAGSTTPAQMVVYYSELIALLQDGIANMLSFNPNPSLTPVLMALQDVLEMKERAGVERAVVSGIFASGNVTDAALMLVTGLIELQKQSWTHFQLYTPKPLAEAVRNLMSDARVQEVENARQQIVARTPKITASDWFVLATARIDLLRKAKDVLATHLVSATIDYRDNLFSQLVWQLLLAVVFIVLALSVFALAMYRLGNGLDLLVDTMVGSAKTKDLSLKAYYPFPDEIGQVAKAFNQMTSDFAMLVEKIRDISTQLASAAEQTSVTTASSAKELSSQMGHTLSVTSAVEELSTSVAEVSTQVQSLDEAITQMHAESSAAEKAVAASVADIHHLNTEVLHINEGVLQLSQNSERITEVVSVIRTIAGQTNLLALNAAIEAARAGEAGRGFAVVADEVRSLAQRTQESTLEIEEMITALQSSVTETSNLISSSQKTVAHSVDLSQTVSDSLGAIFDAIQKTRDLTSQISAASQEQAVASSEVARSAAEVGGSTEYAVENAKQIALVSNDLSKLAAQMAQAANLFRTS